MFTLFSAGLASRVDLWSERLGLGPCVEDVQAYTQHPIERGRACTASDLLSATDRRQWQSSVIASFFETVDLWRTPTLRIPSFPLGWRRPRLDVGVQALLAGDGAFTALMWPLNMTGQPALSQPAHVTPIGVQLAGRFREDEALFGVGDVERMT